MKWSSIHASRVEDRIPISCLQERLKLVKPKTAATEAEDMAETRQQQRIFRHRYAAPHFIHQYNSRQIFLKEAVHIQCKGSYRTALENNAPTFFAASL